MIRTVVVDQRMKVFASFFKKKRFLFFFEKNNQKTSIRNLGSRAP
jgi:hypothetical protein